MSDVLDHERTPQAAAWVAPLRAWLAAGGLPAACPDPRLRGLSAAEPGQPITLTADEAVYLSRMLGCTVAWQPLFGLERDIPSARESLLARGVLELVDGAEVISRDAFPTVGVALLGQRITIVSGPTELGARACRQLAFVRSPGRSVRIQTPDERSYAIEPATLAEIPGALDAELGLDHYPGIDPPIIEPRTFELVDGEPPPFEIAHLLSRDEVYTRLDWSIEDVFVAADGSTARVTCLLLAAPDGLWLEERVPENRSAYRRISLRDARQHLRGVAAESSPAQARWHQRYPAGLALATPPVAGPTFVPARPDAPAGAPPWRLIWIGVAAWLIAAAALGGLYLLTLDQAFFGLGVVVLSPPLVGAYLWARWRITHAPQQTHFTVRPPGEQDARRR